MKINLDLSSLWSDLIDVSKVEQKYNVKFVCETPIRNSGNWRDQSSLIFYNEVAHPQGSNYMALSVNLGYGDKYDLVVSDGISATEGTITGIVDDDEIIYSRFRHDYRVGKSGVFIDGGRDYFRTSNIDKLVTLKIIDGVLMEVENER